MPQNTRAWEITGVLGEDLFIQTDTHSGEKRKVRSSECDCGQPVMIEYNTSHRQDGKRTFYPEDDKENTLVFRCKQCLSPVHESVPYAGFEVTRKMDTC
jgi:hypothetical protein